MSYNLTDAQKDLLREVVSAIRAGTIAEEFTITWTLQGPVLPSGNGFKAAKSFSRGKLEALASANLIHTREGQYHTTVTLTGAAYRAIDDDFDAPDTSF